MPDLANEELVKELRLLGIQVEVISKQMEQLIAVARSIEAGMPVTDIDGKIIT